MKRRASSFVEATADMLADAAASPLYFKDTTTLRTPGEGWPPWRPWADGRAPPEEWNLSGFTPDRFPELGGACFRPALSGRSRTHWLQKV